MTDGKLLAIAIRSNSRADMQEFEGIEITTDGGCAGDFRGTPGSRQVTVMSREAWQAACAHLGQTMPWTARRANLLVEKVELKDTASATLNIGDVVLEITGETDPCERMTELADGLCEALAPHWRGGVCCRVLRGGQINVGDGVVLNDATTN